MKQEAEGELPMLSECQEEFVAEKRMLVCPNLPHQSSKSGLSCTSFFTSVHLHYCGCLSHTPY